MEDIYLGNISILHIGIFVCISLIVAYVAVAVKHSLSFMFASRYV